MRSNVSVKRIHPSARMPERGSEHAAGYDVCACLDSGICIEPGQRALVPTGLSFALPPDMEIQVRPRSGLAIKHGISLVNTPGTIDPDYRGELKVIMINHGDEPFSISHGMRIAQLVFAAVLHPDFDAVDSLDATERGDGGFGHTGL